MGYTVIRSIRSENQEGSERMHDLYEACRALYDTAFPGEPEAFTAAMFDRYFPDCVRVIRVEDRVASMLFSIPYPLITEEGVQEAHYLYAVATHPAYRGRGLAKQLLAAEAARYPVFLRPMTPSLFDFYKQAGFLPFSPLSHAQGTAADTADDACRTLSMTAYLALRDKLVPLPCCRPTVEFLSLYECGGGAVAYGSQAAAVYERQGTTVWFKEYWGDPVFAPRLAAFLGGASFSLRRFDTNGTPFGVGVGMPRNAAFLAALD